MEEAIRSTGGSSFVQNIRAILGTYNINGSGDGFASADWEYIFSGIILVLFIWFVFKIITLIFKNR